MTVRKTESRIPANSQASDLGEAVVAGDGRCALISFIASPLAVSRENVYVLFVTNVALAGTAQSFEWSFTENENPPVMRTTDHGEISYTPSFLGNLTVAVRILDTDNSEKAKLVLRQRIMMLNPELETLIAESVNKAGPGIGNLEVSRELINDHNSFYQGVVLQTTEAADGFKRFVFNMVSDGALQRSAAERKAHLDTLASSLNNNTGNFAALAARGSGVCGIRLTLLAMTLPGLLDWTEMPEESDKNALADEQLSQKLGALEENKQLDLFNLVRFPKSNITQCGRIIEQLRNKYFGNTNFNDVLTGMLGTRAVWIVKHFRKGPLVKT